MRMRIVAAALLLAGLSACGQDGDGSGIASANGGTAAPTATASAAAPADFTKYAQCMRDNGIAMGDPDPATGRPDFDLSLAGTEQFTKAQEKCRDLLPTGGLRGTLDAAQIDALRVFAQCMRDHGVDMPDPDPNGGFGGLLGGAGAGKIDRTGPAFQKAMEACQDKLSGVFPSLGTGS